MISLVSMITLFISFTQFNKSNICRNTIVVGGGSGMRSTGRAWTGSDREENGSARASLIGGSLIIHEFSSKLGQVSNTDNIRESLGSPN